MDKLPQEIFEHILCCPVLTLKDIISFSEVDRHYNDLVLRSNNIWKTYYFQRWPNLKNKIKRVNDWRAHYKSHMKFIDELKKQMTSMSEKLYHCHELSSADFQPFVTLYNSNPHSNHFMKSCVRDQSCWNGNLTHIYYARKIWVTIQKEKLSWKWKEIIESPAEKQVIEKGANIVSRWFAIDGLIPYVKVTDELNSIAQIVKNKLLGANKNHPLQKITEEEQLEWRNKVLTENKFNSDHCQQILECMNNVLFRELQFIQSNREICELPCLETTLVYKHGRAIYLMILYSSVARRLGVRCDIWSFPRNGLLIWKENYSCEDGKCLYIDVKVGSFVEGCPGEKEVASSTSHRSMTCIAQIARTCLAEISSEVMESNVQMYKSCLELFMLLSPPRLQNWTRLSKLYLSHYLGYSGILKPLGTFEPSDTSPADITPFLSFHKYLNMKSKEWKIKNKEPKQIIAKKRPENLKFAVGLIMHHQLYKYDGIIFGWDTKCEAGDEWMNRMQIASVPGEDGQPFYNVLAFDGTYRYVSQENIIIKTDDVEGINLAKTGKYFKRFVGTHYVPNEELAAQYPEDAEVVQQILSTLQQEEENSSS